MKKLLKVGGFFAVAVVLLVVALVLAFYHLIQVGEFRLFLARELERRTGLKASVGSADVRLGMVTGISFSGFALVEPHTGQPVMTSERILVRVALLPLLERKLDFYEIRFQQPTLKLAREEHREARLLELFLPMLSPDRQQDAFTLDLRQIKVEKGEIVFVDRREGRALAPIRLRDIDLSLRRLSGQGLSGSRGKNASQGDEPERVGPGVDFALKAVVERDGSGTRLESRGKVVSPDGELRLERMWLDVETQIESMPVGLFADYYGAVLPPLAMGGTLGARVRWRGIPGQQGQVKGTVELRQLEIDAPRIFAARLAPGGARVELEMEWQPEQVRLARLDWRSGEVSFALRGTVNWRDKSDPELKLELSTPFLPFVKAREFLPFRVFGSPTLEQWAGAVEQGEISFPRISVDGHLSEIRRRSAPPMFGFEAEIQRLGGRLAGEGQLPWRRVSGRVILENGVLHYRGISGLFGNSRISELNGVHRGIMGEAGILEMRARGEVDLAELRALLGSKLAAPSLAQVHGQLKELSGKGKLDIWLRKAAQTPYQPEGRLVVQNAAVRVADFSFNQVSGEIGFSPKAIRFDNVSGLMGGNPVRASGILNVTGMSPFDLTFESPGVKAGLVARLLLGSGSGEEPGTVRGTVRYQGFLASAQDKRVSGSLELVGVQYALFQQPLRDLSGKLRFDGSGIDFQGLKGRLAGSAFEFRGQWRQAESPQLVFTLNAAEADLGRLLAQMGDTSGGWYDRLQARGRVGISKGTYENIEFSDLQTDLALDRRAWRLSNFYARSKEGAIQGSGSITDDRGTPSFAVESKVNGVPVKGFLSWFDMKTTEVTGNVHIAGRLDSSGKTGAERKRNLNGAFHLELEDGVLRRLRILVRILNLIDLSRWFTLQLPDINQEGIRFRRITGDFKVSRGVYSTHNLVVDSDDLRLTGAGKVDGVEGDVDLVVAVRPFPRVTSAVSLIPLIGRGLAAIKNTFLVASFRVTGTVDNPIVIPAPLSTLSEFFFGALEIPKSLLGLPGEERK
ncbi:MAG: AsmA-like C-terminal domain-containing protein [Deltaproteobacteria bacterium]|nr:AsmA-like C-terminal domain-containing protein [Deltaproteobacteria bacterium]